jgi:rhamnogalacturonyl hydrolase YesR
VRRAIAVLCLLFHGAVSVAEDAPDYLGLVRAYADALLEQGRDRYGEIESPLFAAALDRQTMALLEGETLEGVLAMPFDAWGIRAHDRTLYGANPMHDAHLYQVLYVLSEISGDPKYTKAADDALRWFFTHCQSAATGLFAWGEHIGWDFRTEARIDKQGGNTHEFFRPWVLWERSLALAPEPVLAFARGVWEHQIGDHATGNFSRHARYDAHGPGVDSEYPRHGGFYIATWAHAYEHSQDEVFLRAIETVLNYFDGRRHPLTDTLPSESAERSRNTLAWPPSNVSLAVDLHEGAGRVPEPLAAAMRASARRSDDVFLELPHELNEGGRGFVTLADVTTLGKDKVSYSSMWATGYGDSTDAQLANLLALRYRQTGRMGYRHLILASADRYRHSEPDRSIHLYPGTFGDVILLELAAYELTGDPRYRAAARRFAADAAELFLSDGPLPRASSQVDHYEAITRGDTLMMALLTLWLVENTPAMPERLVYSDR